MPAIAPPSLDPAAIAAKWAAPLVTATAPAPECNYLTATQAKVALARIQRRLPSTPFVSAIPSEICGMVRLTMASGRAAYTDVTGRYLLLAFALDTAKGSPADQQEALDEQLVKRDTYPAGGVPGVLPGLEAPADAGAH
jgi:hypothetical protein